MREIRTSGSMRGERLFPYSTNFFLDRAATPPQPRRGILTAWRFIATAWLRSRGGPGLLMIRANGAH